MWQSWVIKFHLIGTPLIEICGESCCCYPMLSLIRWLPKRPDNWIRPIYHKAITNPSVGLH